VDIDAEVPLTGLSFGEPPPDGRTAHFRCSRGVRQPEDGCGSAINRAIL